jgi:hypothetical protein
MKVTTFMISTTAFLTIILSIMLAMILETYNHSYSESSDCSFRIYLVDSSVEVFDNNNFVGRVKIQGELDSLMTDYLQ